MVTYRWIQYFIERQRIVSRSKTGNVMVTPEKQSYIEREVAFHLGVVARDTLVAWMKMMS